MAKMKDEKKAAAGQLLLNMMGNLQRSSTLITIFSERGARGSGLGEITPGEFGIRINTDRPDDVRASVILAHELGHAHARFVEGIGGKWDGHGRAVDSENAARRFYGCNRRIQGFDALFFTPSCQ